MLDASPEARNRTQIKAEELQRAERDEREGGSRNRRDDGTDRITASRSTAAAKPDLTARLVEIYKLGQARYLRLLLSTPDLRRIGQASRTVAALAKIDRDRIAARQRTLEELNTDSCALEQRAASAGRGTRGRSSAPGAAARAAQSRNDLIRDIDRRRDLNAQLSGELQAAQQKLQVALRDPVSSPADALALPFRPFRGELHWPVAGPVVRRFGRSAGRAADRRPMGSRSPRARTWLPAVHDGRCAFAGAFAGFGNLVILDHGSQTFSFTATSSTSRSRRERGWNAGTPSVRSA